MNGPIEDDVNLFGLLEKYEVGSPRLLDRYKFTIEILNDTFFSRSIYIFIFKVQIL